MNLHDTMIEMGVKAVHASRELAKLSTKKKNAILEAMADEIGLQKEAIQAANAKDLAAGREAGLSAAMLDRLTLTDARI
ncbi:MAG: gamma-glutamyl-phosphate reductase, partial [Kiritimatiellales bacterium]|nr:gamma-glutamyl-phosphate reductase [Kiritimatiellales bacterium]